MLAETGVLWIQWRCNNANAIVIDISLVGHSARKRRRGSENIDIEERLESLITRVGEKVNYRKP